MGGFLWHVWHLAPSTAATSAGKSPAVGRSGQLGTWGAPSPVPPSPSGARASVDASSPPEPGGGPPPFDADEELHAYANATRDEASRERDPSLFMASAIARAARDNNAIAGKRTLPRGNGTSRARARIRLAASHAARSGSTASSSARTAS